jgi:trimeric autotransporter adhesin
MNRIVLLLVSLLIFSPAITQNFAINSDGSNAHASALLDVKSTAKGVLVPRMTKAQKNAIPSPATGLLVFQNAPDSVGFYYYNGSGWLWLATASNLTGWGTTGNAGTDTAVNFIGTTTNMPLRFKVNNQWSGQLDASKSNFFIGSNTGRANTTGINNTALGGEALLANTTGGNNTAIGFRAAFANTTASGILAIGDSALYANTTGSSNMAIGSRALRNNITGGTNIAIGKNALASNQLGSQNIAIGENAMANMNLEGLSTNTSNVAIGFGTLENVDPAAVVLSGNQNTAVGNRSGQAITTGYYNTLLGGLSGGAGLNTGVQNTLLGHTSTAGGDDNTQIGFATSSSGNQNTLLGSSSNVNGFRTNAAAIGYRAEVAANNSLVLGSINGVNGATANTNVGIGTTAPTARLDVDADFKLGNNGTVLTEVIKATVNKNIGTVNANSSSQETFAVANAALNSTVYISPATTLANGLIIAYARVSVAGTVEVTFTNTTGANITTGAINYFITVIR